MKLKEIRDDELYKEDGFESFEKYCKERFEYAPRYIYNLITSAEYREKLPPCSSGAEEWNERSVRELKRIPDKKEAARAGLVSKGVEFLNSAQKGISIWTAGIVGLVQGDLGAIGKYQDRIRAQQNAELAETRAEDAKAMFNKALEAKAKALFASGATDVAEAMPGMTIKGGKHDGRLNNVGKALQDSLNELLAPGREKANKYFDESMKSLEDQSSRLRMSSEELAKFRDAASGATVAMQGMLAMMRDALKVAGIKQDNKTPMEKFEDTAKELGRLRQQNIDALAGGKAFDKAGGVGGEIDKAKQGAKGFLAEGAGRGLNQLFGGLLGGIVDVGLDRAKDLVPKSAGEAVAKGVGLDEKNYDLAMGKAFGEAIGAHGTMRNETIPGVGAMLQGSQAELSTMSAFSRRAASVNPVDRAHADAAAALKVAEQQAAYQKAFLAELARLAQPVIVRI
jgi:hypothetical protein